MVAAGYQYERIVYGLYCLTMFVCCLCEFLAHRFTPSSKRIFVKWYMLQLLFLAVCIQISRIPDPSAVYFYTFFTASFLQNQTSCILFHVGVIFLYYTFRAVYAQIKLSLRGQIVPATIRNSFIVISICNHLVATICDSILLYWDTHDTKTQHLKSINLVMAFRTAFFSACVGAANVILLFCYVSLRRNIKSLTQHSSSHSSRQRSQSIVSEHKGQPAHSQLRNQLTEGRRSSVGQSKLYTVHTPYDTLNTADEREQGSAQISKGNQFHTRRNSMPVLKHHQQINKSTANVTVTVTTKSLQVSNTAASSASTNTTSIDQQHLSSHPHHVSQPIPSPNLNPPSSLSTSKPSSQAWQVSSPSLLVSTPSQPMSSEVELEQLQLTSPTKRSTLSKTSNKYLVSASTTERVPSLEQKEEDGEGNKQDGRKIKADEVEEFSMDEPLLTQQADGSDSRQTEQLNSAHQETEKSSHAHRLLQHHTSHLSPYTSHDNLSNEGLTDIPLNATSSQSQTSQQRSIIREENERSASKSSKQSSSRQHSGQESLLPGAVNVSEEALQAEVKQQPLQGSELHPSTMSKHHSSVNVHQPMQDEPLLATAKTTDALPASPSALSPALEGNSTGSTEETASAISLPPSVTVADSTQSQPTVSFTLPIPIMQINVSPSGSLNSSPIPSPGKNQQSRATNGDTNSNASTTNTVTIISAYASTSPNGNHKQRPARRSFNERVTPRAHRAFFPSASGTPKVTTTLGGTGSSATTGTSPYHASVNHKQKKSFFLSPSTSQGTHLEQTILSEQQHTSMTAPTVTAAADASAGSSSKLKAAPSSSAGLDQQPSPVISPTSSTQSALQATATSPLAGTVSATHGSYRHPPSSNPHQQLQHRRYSSTSYSRHRPASSQPPLPARKSSKHKLLASSDSLQDQPSTNQLTTTTQAQHSTTQAPSVAQTTHTQGSTASTSTGNSSSNKNSDLQNAIRRFTVLVIVLCILGPVTVIYNSYFGTRKQVKLELTEEDLYHITDPSVYKFGNTLLWIQILFTLVFYYICHHRWNFLLKNRLELLTGGYTTMTNTSLNTQGNVSDNAKAAMAPSFCVILCNGPDAFVYDPCSVQSPMQPAQQV